MRIKPISNIRKLRYALDIRSQAELARLIKKSKQAINTWENGKTVPSTPNMLRLSKALNCPIDQLFTYPQEEDETNSTTV